MKFLDKLKFEKEHKKIAILLDPDKETDHSAAEKCRIAEKNNVDFIFVGGSTSGKETDSLCKLIKSTCKLPVILFPGNILQISPQADTLLLLSLISGRNPELLIGQHVTAARELKRSKLEIVPVGYILIDGGKCSSVEYISGTRAIPRDKTEIAVSTAIAGEMLGLKVIYLEAGSGALYPVPLEMISAIKKQTKLPLIVGGGIRSPQAAAQACQAGADLIVAGNIFEENNSLTSDFVTAVHSV